jgi:hypothetical protein
MDLYEKFELPSQMQRIEKSVAILIMQHRKRLEKLHKLKDYTTMKKCDFRDEQLDKLLNRG